jgi:amino acid adenylation domain-containing protein
MSDPDTLSARIAALPLEKRELFLQQLQQRMQIRGAIQRQSRGSNAFPLSPAQERLWFMQQMEPDSPVYNLLFAVRLEGKLDIEVLTQSLEKLVRRHEALRTRVAMVEGQPMQVIAPELALSLFVLDLRSLDDEERQACVDEYLKEEVSRPFDLQAGPPVRTGLLCLAEEEAVLSMTTHHMAFDGISLGILHRELWTLYEAATIGTSEALPDLPIQYVDFAAWQREQIQGRTFEGQLEYWCRQLDDLPVVEIPPDKLRPAIPTSAGARCTRTLPSSLLKALEDLSEEENITLFMLLLAAFKTLLYRYIGQSDIVVGTPISDRNRPEFEGLIGLLVNTLVLRTDLSGNPGFRELLQRVRQTCRDGYAHASMPFAHLVKVLQPERDTSHAPLFQVMFVMRDAPTTTRTRQLLLTPRELRSDTSQFDFTLEVVRAGETAQLAVDYRTDLYRAETIGRVLEHFEVLLESIVARPGRRISDLGVLTKEEKQRMLIEWNATECPYPADQCIHQLFEAQVEKTPYNVALSFLRDLGSVCAALETSDVASSADAVSGAYIPLSTAEADRDVSRQDLDHSLLLPETYATLAGCYFKKASLLYPFRRQVLQHVTDLAHDEINDLHLLFTRSGVFVVVSDDVLNVLERLDGQQNLARIAESLAAPVTCTMGLAVANKDTGLLKIENETTFMLDNDYQSWSSFIQALYSTGLVELVGYSGDAAGDTPSTSPRATKEVSPDHSLEAACIVSEPPPQAPSPDALSPVLLLGSSVGQTTIGLAYLASFLRRCGIEACCQLNDFHEDSISLRRNVHSLLDKVQPRLVGVSLKWFPHVARGLAICRLVKEYSPEIQVVLGGDTATYFAHHLIENETVDYVVLGDGEIPLLRICQQARQIPNCVYKRDGRVIANPISYLHQKETLAQIYLSHLDEIFVSPADLILAPYVFVFTGRGCPMNCHYCGGACEVQANVFKRPQPYFAMRGLREVRNDIVRLKEYTSAFLFDFDLPTYDSFKAYGALWEGIDLSAHFGNFYFWQLPAAEFIELVASTFGFASLNIDLNSLAERHRQVLTNKQVVKPQPTDDQVFAFFAECEKYDNVKTTVNLINGLPFFTEEDIPAAKKALDKIIKSYKSFEGMGWGRLHAQPGAPITKDYAAFEMQPSAVTYEDYLRYSELNMQEERYPSLPFLHYPSIYYQDERLNSRVTGYYVDTIRTLRGHTESRRRKQQLFEETMSYLELNQKANQLARYLRKKGVRTEERVGIYLERSIEMIVAILAVLKAGGAYIPLDPSYPAERLSFMAQDARISVLLTTGALSQSFVLSDVPAVRLDVDWEEIDQESSDNLAVRVAPDNLAYVLYTSGSTGKPKGVMIEHRGVSNLAQAQAAAFAVQPSSRVLQFAPFSFDASVSEVFVTLLSGATLCLAPQDMLLPGPDLVTVLQKQAPSVLTSPPSVWAALPDIDLPYLRTAVSAGEACSPDIVARWAPERRFINAYGPTETTVCATLTECVPGDNGQPPPIGRAIDNTKVYLLDQNLQPVPVGVAGEIHLDTVGLARGYFGRPGLTAERLIPNPFDGRPGSRLYKTGDLACYLPDGVIRFLGRVDQQVKIRGSRVEIGEIEATLARHPAVRENAVIVQDDTGETRLVAYIVPHYEQNVPGASELRGFLRTTLPEYMVPYAFVALGELPKSPSGKVDRKTLPRFEHSRPDLDETFVAPRTPVEELVAEVWAHCLDVEKIGVYDNFFELGGHSLLITQVISKMAEVFQIELPVRVFFDTPTVSSVAQALIEREPTPGHVDTVARLHRRISAMSAEEISTLLDQRKPAD